MLGMKKKSKSEAEMHQCNWYEKKKNEKLQQMRYWGNSEALIRGV